MTAGAARVRDGVVALVGLALVATVLIGTGGPAPAAVTAGQVTGAGGAFAGPLIEKLLHDDTSNLAPITPFYSSVTLDQGIAAFIGSAAGSFGADFAVTERPLTATEAATAQSDGRSFVYVPFAATPVALVTMVLSEAAAGSSGITAGSFCQHIPLSMELLGEIFGLDTTSPLASWGDSRLTCSDGTALAPEPISLWANLDPTMENETLMTLLDSDPTSKALFDAGLQDALANHKALTSSDTPSELWPYSSNAIPGGDQPLIGKMVTIDPRTNAPSEVQTNWQLGAIAPISTIWTGAPLGVPWDFATASIPNAQGSLVAPSETSAAAAEADAALDVKTNLVTFDSSNTTDAGSYNSDMMVEDYLVVPTSGLDAATANALASLVRFVAGPTGQADTTSFGSAPPTAAMVTADLAVAAELNQEAATAPSSTTTTTTTSGTTTTTTTTAAGAALTGSSGSSTTGGLGSDGTDSTSGLAFTGSDPTPIIGAGLGLVAVGAYFRRRFRDRKSQATDGGAPT